MEPVFHCDYITKCYEGEPVVRSISIQVHQGEIVSLLGPSGVGKTTLMSVLSGVEKPEHGQVILQGSDITGCPGKVSYMLQKDLLLPHKTVLDNVSLPLVIQGIAKKQARSTAQSHFKTFGLEGSERKYPHQLSGGMRQRAALLRTWLIGNQVLLLDEPFSALDAMTRSQIQMWYLDIHHAIRTATFLITHDIDEALIMSDRIYVMNGVPGQIVQEVPVKDLRQQDPLFNESKEYMAQKGILRKALELLQ